MECDKCGSSMSPKEMLTGYDGLMRLQMRLTMKAAYKLLDNPSEEARYELATCITEDCVQTDELMDHYNALLEELDIEKS